MTWRLSLPMNSPILQSYNRYFAISLIRRENMQEQTNGAERVISK